MERLIVDEEIELRIRKTEDAERTFELIDRSRSYLKKWLPWVDSVQTVQDCVDFITLNRTKFDNGEDATYGIFYKDELVGLASYHTLDKANRNTDMGYWMGEAYQGKGIMSRAVSYLTEYAFSYHKLHRVQIRCATENRGSRAIPEKLGFTLEGILRGEQKIQDEYLDICVYSRLSTD